MISFIVPAYNEANQIADVVRSIHESARMNRIASDHYEIIVVNDGSTDQTAEFAAATGAIVLNVEKRQIAAVRNAGAAAARGETLIFVDGDTYLNAFTLSIALDALARGAVGGGAMVRFDHAPRAARIAIALTARGLKLAGCCGGCFLYCTRGAFDAVGGFDNELFASEEVDFAKALGRIGRFVIVPHPVVTSGRKVRQYSIPQLIGVLLRIGMRGEAGVRTRDGLDVWYDGLREPPPGSFSPKQRGVETG